MGDRDRLVIVPEVTVAAATIETVKATTTMIHETVMPSLEVICRDFLPATILAAEAGDGVAETFDERSGWGELFSALVALAGGAMAAAARVGDVDWPEWLSEEDKLTREVDDWQAQFLVERPLTERLAADDEVSRSAAVDELQALLRDRGDCERGARDPAEVESV